jgi:hypothetical protein
MLSTIFIDFIGHWSCNIKHFTAVQITLDWAYCLFLAIAVVQITLDWAYCLFLAIAVVQITLDWAYCLFLAIAVFALTHLHLPEAQDK